MSVKPFEEHVPDIHPEAYVDPAAYVSGQTTLGEGSSVWPMAVVRGDINVIRIGRLTNVQDGAVLHVTHGGEYSTPEGRPLTIGDEVTIGHRAVLHACTIGNRCLVGMGAIVLDGAVVEDEVMIGAGSLVPPGKRLASGHLYVGNPVKQARPLTEKEKAYFSYSAAYYARLAGRTRNSG
ncbi:gamma carbonic anhydrase family protein [Candidatus Thiothrix sp. Deng01]|uniref:Gamma carbonic anhydrase family protein n=1 Tax=Candidatus Thiothrix phosphatis TaxID=3112415 RepID=A0ABU6CUF4_9GAMM|nr:gamma carbonic anhydrase family protein [Candidatus Thiothrix sp. Deng01]MEB4590471.1 gamma carbonic anhydrase family protein [Candidatus Thiothrix sp. Deng01]